MAARLPGVLTRENIIPRLGWSIAGSNNNNDQSITFGEIITAMEQVEALQVAVAPLPAFIRDNLAKTQAKVTFFGESHHQPACLAAQIALQKHISTTFNRSIMIMEHFNVTHNAILKEYCQSTDEDTAFTRLSEEYSKSSEGFHLSFYRPLLEAARASRIPIRGGFPDRNWAKTIFREGVGASRKEFEHLEEMKSFRKWENCRPTATHAALVKGMISGEPIRLLPTDGETLPTDSLKGLAVAQAFKDAFMAQSIDDAVQNGYNVLAVCGSGHLEYGCGVKERLSSVKPDETFTIIAKSTESEIWQCEKWGEADESSPLLADALFFYEAV